MIDKFYVINNFFLILAYGKKIRLTNSNSSKYGRLEVYYRTKWAPICDTLFGKIEADVACIQLGFKQAVNFSCCSHYDRLYTGRYYMNNLYCRGYEKSLFDCGYSSMINYRCPKNKAVGVFCSGEYNCYGCIILDDIIILYKLDRKCYLQFLPSRIRYSSICMHIL